MAEAGRSRLLKLVAAVVVFAAAVLHFVYLASHWNDRLMALLYGLIGTGLFALFFAARVAGPSMGIKPEVVGSLTVLRKSLEAFSVLLLALSLRKPKIP